MRLALAILSATALLASGCSEAEGPLPFDRGSTRVSNGRDDQSAKAPAGETRAPKGSSTLTLRATGVIGSPDSRAVIEPDPDGASVVWEAGDVIRVQFLKDGVCDYGDLVTEEGGSATAEFTTDDDILGGTDYIFFAPCYKNFRETNYLTGKRVFGLQVPASQTAVADGVMAGSNLAFARSDSFEDGMSLTFTNLPALLRFSLAGDIVPQVKEVTLRTTSVIAGDMLIYDAGGYPDFHPGRIKNVDTTYSSITLSGDFEAGKDYHIALWPRELSYFEMEFSDGAGHGKGHSNTLRSSQKINLGRSVVTDIGAIDIGNTFNGPGTISTTPVKYMSATEGAKPVSVAVVPDGFTLAELPLYESLAKSALDFLFDTEPYKTYKSRFNAWILKVASNQSGAGVTDGKGNVVTPVDNYFGTKWGADSYDDMRADDNKVYNYVKKNCPDIKSGIHTINEVPIIIIVNDSRYAGRAWFWSDGFSYCMIPWFFDGGSTYWSFPKIVPDSESDPETGWHYPTDADLDNWGRSSGDWRSAVMHEFGHTFGRLLDEYWGKTPTTAYDAERTTLKGYQSWTVPCGLNISTSYSDTPWDEFLDRREELMAIDQRYSRIGVFQGGVTYLFGIWRSEMVSGMQDNRQYFNAWSRYLLAKRIMTLSGDIAKFNFNYWLERDVTADPLRDGTGDTRSGDTDRSGRYYYIFPHDPEEYFPPDAPPGFVEDEYSYVRTD